MKYAILIVGTELTQGLKRDGNSSKIALELSKIGLEVSSISTVPDDLLEIKDAIGSLLSKNDLLIMTGGLGPTLDDLTRNALAEYFGQELSLDPKLLEVTEDRYCLLGRKMQEAIKRQAERFSLAEPILPINGTAPGLIADDGKRVTIALPGVPSEMMEMLLGSVSPYLVKRFGLTDSLVILKSTLSGINEVEAEERLSELFDDKSLKVSLIPHQASVEVHLSALISKELTQDFLAAQKERLIRLLGEDLIGFDSKKIETVLGEELKKRGLSLSLAESCTGGLISKRITDVPGSSSFFLGSVVCYSNDVKEEVLGVPKEDLIRFGAVSESVARSMAQGVSKLLSSDIGLSVTGIAGPDGGSKEKPVGLVYIGLSHGDINLVEKSLFPGDRSEIRTKSSEAALRLLRKHLLKA